MAIRQRGVALISALLVVALATTAAVALTTDMQVTLRRSANLFTRDQAWQYLQGVEAFGEILLGEAIKHDKLDLLLGEERALPVDGGVVTGKVTDLQAAINLNNLRDADHNEVALARTRELFNNLGVEQRHLDALVDWLDQNNDVTGSNGAEDNYYSGLAKPYRAANREFASLTELYLVRGMKPEIVDKLLRIKGEEGEALEVVTVLPTTTSVNINTANRVVLDSLELDGNVVDQIVDNRPYKSMDEVKALIPENKRAGLDVKSAYFQLETSAQIGRAQLRAYSIIHRDEQGVMRVVSRSLGTR